MAGTTRRQAGEPSERVSNMIEPRTPDSVKVIRVIEVKAIRGTGTDENPGRIVVQLWSLDGKLLAEADSEHPKWQSNHGQ